MTGENSRNFNFLIPTCIVHHKSTPNYRSFDPLLIAYKGLRKFQHHSIDGPVGVTENYEKFILLLKTLSNFVNFHRDEVQY